jgi:dTDP-4-amino-4,6-dideoxygalactose transaminase
MFETIDIFEKQISNFYGAPYAVATDCCTHAIELCLRMLNPTQISCPSHTYLSVAMTFEKLNISWNFLDNKWNDYYYINNTNIVDAAVFWKEKSYIKNTLFCLSFQYKKHLSLGRGGAVLCSSLDEYTWLKKSSYDGRLPNLPWADQNIDQLGYHYYMTPETAQLGIDRLPEAINTVPKTRSWKDYPDISKMKVFQ